MSATQATAEQLAQLAVPATLPGVVRRGTPVLYRTCLQVPYRVAGRLAHGTCIGVVDGMALVVCDEFHDHYRFRLDEVMVDLTDATGRAHLCWTVAGKVGWPDAVGRAYLEWTDFGDPFGGEGWTITGGLDDGEGFRTPVSGADSLDPSDDTRLPDGSRLVDALALKAVALHVLGT